LKKEKKNFEKRKEKVVSRIETAKHPEIN